MFSDVMVEKCLATIVPETASLPSMVSRFSAAPSRTPFGIDRLREGGASAFTEAARRSARASSLMARAYQPARGGGGMIPTYGHRIPRARGEGAGVDPRAGPVQGGVADPRPP